jgi:hypothetical protein
MGEWRYSSTSLNLGTRWSWVVSFTPRPLYSRWKSLRYPLDTKVNGPQRRSAYCGVENSLLLLPGIKPRTSSLYPVVIPTELSRLHANLYFLKAWNNWYWGESIADVLLCRRVLLEYPRNMGRNRDECVAWCGWLEPRRLTTLWASAACYRGFKFTLLFMGRCYWIPTDV